MRVGIEGDGKKDKRRESVKYITDRERNAGRREGERVCAKESVFLSFLGAQTPGFYFSGDLSYLVARF